MKHALFFTGIAPAARRQAWRVLLLLALAAPARAQLVPPKGLDVPYEPSPQAVVERMLDLAAVDSRDLVYDLGSGDGRIVISAAKRGAHSVGIDLDPRRIAEAQANARAASVEDRTQFRLGNLYESDFSQATVVTLFLWPQVNRKLRPQLWRQLKPGTRVVSYIWDMGEEWPPERTERIGGKPIHYWTITEALKTRAGGER